MAGEVDFISDDWNRIDDADGWNHALAVMNGHPLQSAAWGEGRRKCDGLESFYLQLSRDGRPCGMARVETRNLPLFGKVAWVPRGPVFAAGSEQDLQASLCLKLKCLGFVLAIFDPYRQTNVPSQIRTIWIDLTIGAEALKKRIDKRWMYGVRRAAREGVEVVRATTADEVAEFFRMYAQISEDKGFELPGSEALMRQLLFAPQNDGESMQLFLAKHDGKIGAGAFVARLGDHLHYIWGGSDRELSRQRVGEAVQWAVLEWGMAEGCSRYDLEGIDPANNPGVYAFKRRMGGEEVVLAGKHAIPLSLAGRLALLAGRLTGRI